MGNTDQAQGTQSGGKVSSTDLVYQAVVDAREMGKVATRQTIQQTTSLPLTIVDDRVKHLKAIGRIRLAGNVAGVFEPVEDPEEDRSISVTFLPNGKVKYEIGDTVILMSKREAMHSGLGFGGLMLLFRG